MSDILYGFGLRTIHIVKGRKDGFYISYCGQYLSSEDITVHCGVEQTLCKSCKKAKNKKITDEMKNKTK